MRDGMPGRMKVLIADDDGPARAFLRAALRKLDFDSVIATDGRDAWDQYRSSHPSLVLADWVMPELSGIDLCRMIRAENRSRYTYIILITALSGKGSYLQGMEAGADDIVTKPFDLEEMAAKLRVARRILGLQTELKQLDGLIPVCAHCRRIRDEREVWSSLEDYVTQLTDLRLSQSVCPTCYEAGSGAARPARAAS